MLKVIFQIWTLLSLISFSAEGVPQSVSTLIGARSAALGYASATLSDEWSIHNNVAGLCSRQPDVAFVYDARPAMPGADRIAAAISVPVFNGTAGLGSFRFGDELYSESVISAGYANRFGLASLGLRLNYIQYHASGYGTKSAIAVSFGGIAHLTPSLQVGAYATNLNQPMVSINNKERLPTSLIAGIGFKPSGKVLLVIEILKDIAFDPTIKLGVEYEFAKSMKFRTACNLHPGAAFIGLGYSIRKIKIDYALQYNYTMSASQQASVCYRLVKHHKHDDP